METAASAGQSQTTLTYFNLPAPYTAPWALLNSPNGSIYFSELQRGTNDSGIGQLLTGQISEQDLGPNITTPIAAVATFGQLWFSDVASNTFDFIYLPPPQVVHSFSAPASSRPRFAAMDPSGNVWYALMAAEAVARVAPDGTWTTFPVPKEAFNLARPNDIVLGPDNAFWITEQIGNAIVRMSLAGTVTNVFPLPTQEAFPRFITVGKNGKGDLWFSELGSEAAFGDPGLTPPQIVKLTTGGVMTAYPMPSAFCAPDSIRPATGGFVFSDLGTNAVGFVGKTGEIKEYPLPVQGGVYGNVQFTIEGPDGSYYFADMDMNRIGKITLGAKGMIFPQTISIAGSGNTQLVGVAIAGEPTAPFVATIDNASVASVAPVTGAFPVNFNVTAVGPGNATLTIAYKSQTMKAPITVTTTTAALRQGSLRRVRPQ